MLLAASPQPSVSVQPSPTCGLPPHSVLRHTVTPSSTSVPRHTLSVPRPRRQLVSRHQSHFPEAQGSQYPVLGCLGPTLARRRPAAAPGPRDQRPCKLAQNFGRTKSQRTHVPSHDYPSPQAFGRLRALPGTGPAGCPPPHSRVSLELIPTQASASATGLRALVHKWVGQLLLR